MREHKPRPADAIARAFPQKRCAPAIAPQTVLGRAVLARRAVLSMAEPAAEEAH